MPRASPLPVLAVTHDLGADGVAFNILDEGEEIFVILDQIRTRYESINGGCPPLPLHSVIKRRLGSFLRARTYWSQLREMMLRLFAYNVLVVWRTA